MTIAPRDKQNLLDRLTRARINGVNIAVLRAIAWHLNVEHGVAFCWYNKYAERSGRSERTVQRTIQIACAHGILGREYRSGAPVIWFRDLMDMEPAEAVRRANLLSQGKNAAKLAPPPGVYPPSHPRVYPASPAEVYAASPSSPDAADTASFAWPSLASNLAPGLPPNVTPQVAPEVAHLKPPEEQTILKNEELSPPPPKHGGLGWRSMGLPSVSSTAHDLSVEIGKRCGLRMPTFDWPEHWRLHAPQIVQSWLTDFGWQRDRIVEVVAETMKAKQDGPPASIRYFEKPIARSYAARGHSELHTRSGASNDKASRNNIDDAIERARRNAEGRR